MAELKEDGINNERNTNQLAKHDTEHGCQVASKDSKTDGNKVKVTYHLRDIQQKMVSAWKKLFEDHQDQVKISQGDIFMDGPAVDAIVSPANSFGFMDGGIDMVYTNLFGWQMQRRLQQVIREKHDGEIIVGNAVIIPAFDNHPDDTALETIKEHNMNNGQPIKYLISAPTMRVPKDVFDTPNAYLAFRAVILSVQKHNDDPVNQPIRSVLCPGLGTAVGRMPFDRCAFQMLQAYEMYEKKSRNEFVYPENLWTVTNHNSEMETYEEKEKNQCQQ